MSARKIRGALWINVIEHAERLHDLTVMSQRRGTKRSAERIRDLASEVAILAGTVVLLDGGGSK